MNMAFFTMTVARETYRTITPSASSILLDDGVYVMKQMREALGTHPPGGRARRRDLSGPPASGPAARLVLRGSGRPAPRARPS